MNTAEVSAKSDIRATPAHLQQIGAMLKAAQPKAPVTGVVALAFNHCGGPHDGVELANDLIIRAGGQRVFFEQLAGLGTDQATISSIWNLNAHGGPVMIFSLPDMTKLADICVPTAETSWGRNLQSAVIRAHVDLTKPA